MVAGVFLALMVLFLSLDLKAWQKALGIGLTVIGASFCHYTIGILAVLYLIGSLMVLLIGKAVGKGIWGKFKLLFALPLVLIIIACVGINVLWFGNVAGGCVLNGWENIGGNVAGSFGSSGAGSPDNMIATLEASTSSGAASHSLYLYQQEPMVRTAIGLDFVGASLGGKAFRVVQYATELLLVAGFGYLLFRYRKYGFTVEFAGCVVVSFILLLVCVFLPGFSAIINVTRFYQVSLFFLAPMMVIGVEEIVGDAIGLWHKRVKAE
jgi:uncharacterized membrane protein